MFELNGQNTEELGLYFKKGGLNRELLKPPVPKERYTYDWGNQNGLERDTLSPVCYEVMQYTISCYLVADNLSSLLNNRDAIIGIISNPEGFTFKSHALGKSYKMYYKSSNGFVDLTPLSSNGKLYCAFTLVVENDYESTVNNFYLADTFSSILTEEGENIVVENESINF